MTSGAVSMPRPLGRRRAGAVDAALSALALAFALVLMASGRFAPSDGGRELDALGVVLAIGTAAPLLARRRAPAAAFAVVVAATASLYGLGYSLGPAIGAVVALFSLSVAAEGGRVRVARVVVAVAGLLTIALVHVLLRPGPEGFLGVLVFAGAWFAGDWARHRHEHAAQLEARAGAEARDREREHRLELAEQRARIARDLHDSAGHAISVILVQAGAARLLRDRDPEAAAAALDTVESVARETITDIDRIVRALRESDGAPATAPSLGLAGVPDLIARYRADGRTIALVETGRRRPLPMLVEGAAYRIVQEGLTNAARHGGPDARVAIDFGERWLRIAIDNDRPRPGPPREGNGLAGMRERAAMLGGRLEVERRPDRFTVRALIPLGEER